MIGVPHLTFWISVWLAAYVLTVRIVRIVRIVRVRIVRIVLIVLIVRIVRVRIVRVHVNVRKFYDWNVGAGACLCTNAVAKDCYLSVDFPFRTRAREGEHGSLVPVVFSPPSCDPLWLEHAWAKAGGTAWQAFVLNQ